VCDVDLNITLLVGACHDAALSITYISLVAEWRYLKNDLAISMTITQLILLDEGYDSLDCTCTDSAAFEAFQLQCSSAGERREKNVRLKASIRVSKTPQHSIIVRPQ
jgi:hypothetical protein